MQSLEEIKRANNPPHPPLNERLRHAHVRNFGIAISDEDVHALVELLDAAEEEPHVSAELRAAMRRVRGR